MEFYTKLSIYIMYRAEYYWRNSSTES